VGIMPVLRYRYFAFSMPHDSWWRTVGEIGSDWICIQLTAWQFCHLYIPPKLVMAYSTPTAMPPPITTKCSPT
jgi:hypothetical protein